MANKIILKKSSVTNRVPTESDLVYGELALNYADGLLYYKTAANTIAILNASSSITAGDGLSLSESTLSVDSSVLRTTGTQTITGTKTVRSSLLYQSPDQANTISSNMLNGGTLSFEGSSGQLFSIADSMTGTIFSVNDISGIPSIEVLDTGLVKLAEYGGNVLIGSGTDNGVNTLQVGGSAAIGTSSANYLTVAGSSTGNAVSISTAGSDTNIDLALTPKGTGNVVIANNGSSFNIRAGNSTGLNTFSNLIFDWFGAGNGFKHFISSNHNSAANNANNSISFWVNNSATAGASTSPSVGNTRTITTTPINTTISTAGGDQFNVSNTASAVNYVQVTGAATGGTPAISVQGSDSNININLQAKGAGQVRSIGWMSVGIGAPNYWQLASAASGSAPVLSVQGSDTNININLQAKGAGQVRSIGWMSVGIGAPNYWQLASAASGSAPVLSVQGSDTNIDLALNPKGTGAVLANGPLQVDTNLVIDSFTATTTAVSADQVLVTLNATVYRAVKFLIRAVDATSNKYHTTEILAIHNGTIANSTEYGSVNIGGVCATFDVDYSAGSVRLLTTPTSANSTVFTVVVQLLK